MLDRDREALKAIRIREKLVEGFAILRCDECGVEERTVDCLRLAQQCRECHGWMRLVTSVTYHAPRTTGWDDHDLSRIGCPISESKSTARGERG